ncbi:MAG TPA: glycoside hydrolase family 76 protein, partial [Thermoleophilia bacterium]|nr:glycoside hydrolase family 76 protein [Thermoleophilia bacterium]
RLYDPRTGAVYDRIVAPPSGAGPAVVRRTGLTYNQGSFIGAAELLYKATGRRPYYDDALRTLEYTRLHLTGPGGILPSEAGGPDSNGGGFKGIFCRWAVTFTHDNHITSFDAWFQQNASVAWSHRDARGLMGADWSSPTPIGRLYAWDCSAAVVLMQVTSGR